MSKKPLFALITDTHSDKDNYLEIEDLFVQLVDYCHENSIGTVIHNGDWFKTRTGQSLQVLSSVRKIFKLFGQHNINLLTFAGNHDKTDLDSMVSYIDLFSSLKNVMIARREKLMYDDGVRRYYMIPYFYEEGSYPERLQSINSELQDGYDNFLFTHISVNGVKNNDGSVVDNGIPTSSFKKFKKVYVGHYHDESRVGKNIHYFGSAKQANYGENEDKGFVVRYDDDSEKRIQFQYRRFLKLTQDLSEGKQSIIKLLAKAREMKSTQELNLRIEFHGSEDELLNNEPMFLKFKEIGVDVVKTNTEGLKSMEAAENEEVVEFNFSSILKSHIVFCNENKIDKSRTKLGIQYLNKAKNVESA